MLIVVIGLVQRICGYRFFILFRLNDTYSPFATEKDIISTLFTMRQFPLGNRHIMALARKRPLCPVIKIFTIRFPSGITKLLVDDFPCLCFAQLVFGGKFPVFAPPFRADTFGHLYRLRMLKFLDFSRQLFNFHLLIGNHRLLIHRLLIRLYVSLGERFQEPTPDKERFLINI